MTVLHTQRVKLNWIFSRWFSSSFSNPSEKNDFTTQLKWHRCPQWLTKDEVLENLQILDCAKLDGKTKKKSNLRNGDLERRGNGSCGIQSPESQELRAAEGAASLITLKCSET